MCPNLSIYQTALKVSPGRISMMDDLDLNRLMDLLLRAQAYKCDSSRKEIRVNTESRAKDDGCDGWSAKPKKIDDWLGSTDTCWQFKTGTAGEPGRLVGEVNKRIPRETLINGGRFVVIACGSQNGKKGEEDRLEVLKKEAKAAKIPSKNIEVIGSERLTNWINQNPAVAAFWAGRPAGLWTLDDWANSDEHQVPWQASATVQSDINARRVDLDFTAGNVLHLHIYGPPGVGKTRFALELCREAAWHGTVIYIRDATTDIRLLELIDSVTAETGIQLIVVADEVQPEQLIPLRDSVARGNGRVRLITVGNCPSPDSRRIPALKVMPLEPAIMQKVVKGWYPAMPFEHVDFVVRFADGYVRLAHLAADAVAQSPSMDVRGLLNRDEIHLFLDKMLGVGDRRALYVVAVLTSVGWTGDKQEEGKAIADHLHLDWNWVRATVDDFNRRLGIAPHGGRFRYISPTPLGIHLAVEAWSTYPDFLNSLPNVLPSEEAREAYYNRLQSIASNPQAREYARGELASFFCIDDFKKVNIVRRWSSLSSADPDAAARNILKALTDTTFEDRLQIKNLARREMVWTLVRLAWKRSSFHDSVKSLALLAEAENEEWANNASGEFVARFQIFLSGTAVPYLERLTVIDELMVEGRTSLARLAVKALTQAGNRQNSRIMSAPASDELPEKEWQPNTPKEQLKCIEVAITRLSKIAEFEISDLQIDLVAAAEYLSEYLSSSLLRKHVVDLFEAIYQAYPDSRESLRKVIASTISNEKKYWKRLSSKELKELETLHARFEDHSLGSRLQQEVGQISWDSEEQLDLKPLAKELLSKPEVLSEYWPWLTSGKASDAWRFGEALAIVDAERRLAEKIPLLPRGGGDSQLLCGYINVQRRTVGDEWYDKWMASQFERNPKPIALMFDVALRCGATDAVASMMATILCTEQVNPQIVDRLGYGNWGNSLNTDVLETILQTMIETGHNETAIIILAHRMKSNSSEIEHWKPLALKLVTTSDLIKSRGMVSYYWQEVANYLISEYPVNIAAAIIHEQASRKVGLWSLEHSEVSKVFSACAMQEPRKVWQVIKKRLSSATTAYRLHYGFPRGVLDLLPVTDIEVWVAKKPEERAEMIAWFAKKDMSADDNLASRILGQYGDNEQIADAFFSEYVTGSWSGPASEHWEQLAESLEEIAKRTVMPKLHSWADRSVCFLREMAQRDQQREEEEKLRRR
jgi:hypothetical protein